ncbi:unnamed protein product [Paramecium pentaurelia]|uniref:Transmembrane protein n=1 Tax=Paramecium pentaurelia TaxID=43138 RepID=A0A8S1Y8H9_9CILI|nr:unnamed protein product [Paramecium pentaurelia]
MQKQQQIIQFQFLALATNIEVSIYDQVDKIIQFQQLNKTNNCFEKLDQRYKQINFAILLLHFNLKKALISICIKLIRQENFNKQKIMMLLKIVNIVFYFFHFNTISVSISQPQRMDETQILQGEFMIFFYYKNLQNLQIHIFMGY